MILFKIVAPCAGAWIEICLPCGVALYRATSLPVRERGLKWIDLLLPACVYLVAPCAGAWIEIGHCWQTERPRKVAPCAGAWIEIVKTSAKNGVILSLPVRERGLKS